MKTQIKPLCISAIAILFACAVPPAQAALVTLDFDSAATGANLLSSPLVTTAGTVSLVNPQGLIFTSSFVGNNTKFLYHSNSPTPGFAELHFDFDVSSISFEYTGYGSGSFVAEVLDSNNAVIGSFFDNPANPPDWNPSQTITASGIRTFRFRDTVSGQSGVDNLFITPVPEPGTALFGLACLGVIAARRRRVAVR